MNLMKTAFFALPLLVLLTSSAFGRGIDEILMGFNSTFSLNTTYHLFGIIGVGVWSNQARNSRIGNLSVLFVISLGVASLMGMSIDLNIDFRPIIAGEIILIGLLIGSTVGLTAIWDVVVVMVFGFLHGLALGAVAKGQAVMLFPIGVVISGAVLLFMGAVVTWVFGIRSIKGGTRKNGGPPFVGGIFTGAGITILIWVLR